jgi:hypothetical protein
VGEEFVSVLRAGGEVEFSFLGLRDCAAGIAAVCGAALPKLVSAQNSEAGELEGQELRGVGFRARGFWIEAKGVTPRTESRDWGPVRFMEKVLLAIVFDRAKWVLHRMKLRLGLGHLS